MRKRLSLLLASAVACTLMATAAQAGPADDDMLVVTPAKTTSGQAVTSYLHDVSQPIPGVDESSAIVEQHRVTALDGIKLDTWIVRPNIVGPVPVVLQLTPYYGGGNPVLMLALNAELTELLKRGYAVGIASLRGTGNSEGCFTIGGPAEAKDSAAVIEHYAAQPWSNGNVGLIGVSYDGTAPQDAWVEAPPHLKTIVPISGISDLYKYNYVNGVPINDTIGFNTYYWAIVGLGPAGLELGTQAADPVSIPGAIKGEVCQERIEITEETATSLMDGNKDQYWQARDFAAELAASPKKKRASVFYIHGLEDWNVKTHNMEGWVDAIQRTGVPFKAWLGQWGHAWPDRNDWHEVMTAWFDQFLKNRDTGVLDAPKVQVQDDAATWRHESRYPPASAAVVVHPQVSGQLRATPGTGFASFDDYAGAPVSPNVTLPDDRVVFTSAPLSEDLHLSGMPRFEGAVTASGRRANLMLSLAEQKPDGTLHYLNYAALSLNHAADLAQGKPSVAGLRQQVAVSFFPQDDVVQKGSRLVLVAAGNLVQAPGAAFSMQPIADGSRVVLDLTTTRLVLPHDTTLTIEPTE